MPTVEHLLQRAFFIAFAAAALAAVGAMEQKEEEKGHEISISHWLLLERGKETVWGKGINKMWHFLGGNTVKKVFLF